MKVLRVFFCVILLKTSLCGTPGFGDLYSNFLALSQAFFNSVNGIADYNMNDAISYPVSTRSFINDIKCKVESYPTFLANATSRFSGVDAEIIYEILTGHFQPPFPSPLELISDGLLAIRNEIDYLVNTVAVNMETLYKPSDTSNITSCIGVTTTVLSYLPSLTVLVNERATQGVVDYNAYAALNLTDIYVSGLPRLQYCDAYNVANAVAGLLGATNSESLFNYLSGKSTELAYPFVCTTSIFDAVNQTINNAYTSLANNGTFILSTTTTTTPTTTANRYHG